MSAVISVPFGNRSAIRAAEVGNAAFERAVKLGYSRLTALQFSRQAKKVAHECETPKAVALRVVRPKVSSATHSGYTPTGGSAA